MIEGQMNCLEALSSMTNPEDMCVPFWPIQEFTGYDRKTVRRHVRALARKGLAQFYRGLWNDDGPAGSGYCITQAGLDSIWDRPDYTGEVSLDV